jgi:selenocysteine lyase/cysteine desulfurase
MNPPVHPLAYKDAIFFSPHKFLGGVSSPGILVLKKKLFRPKGPSSNPGGGTVFFVSKNNHIWDKYFRFSIFFFLSNFFFFCRNFEQREEGGTP